ncbi:MAG TPA: 23S rRNA (uracil(1939)-C(5))-methyltransferase RlmD [Thermodesulfobacteriota bacterium]|nr:23S rRNA (uracil(1939)-C(5))-methyltransferase RlmD [Thermodesulfobacteriota bacterium]
MNREARVSVTSMAFKGYGVSRLDHQVIFIHHSVTGDEAWIEIIEQKRNYSMGNLKKLIVPSPWRVEPECPYFGRCGGCQWQHIDKTKQAEIKRDILQEVLHRLAGLKEIPPVSMIPSLLPYGYRVRVQLKAEERALGYYQTKSHQIVDINHCPISHPLINQIISILREKRPSLRPFKEVEIRVSPEEGRGALIIQPLSFQQVRSFAEELLRDHAIVKGIVIRENERITSFGDPLLTFPLSFNRHCEQRSLRFRASPGSFFQVNLEQNQVLIQTVVQFAEVNQKESVLDLYAGIGNFTLPLALSAREVVGVEENKAAVEDARFNAQENGISRCDIIHGKVGEVLEHWEREKPDLVVLDPPRTGSKEIVRLIAGLKPKKIIYVSCEPTTLSRDLSLFTENGYSLQKLSLIDMFPQSYHMEVVALLKAPC